MGGAPPLSARAALALISLALLGGRLLTAVVVAQPGYTDAYYYVLVAERVARGEGLVADFVWNFLEVPAGSALPVPSHRFWMPLATLIQAPGIALFGELLGTFRAAQAALILLAALIPAAAYACARALGAGTTSALASATLAGLGGAFAPAWVSLDSFVPAALLGSAFFLLYRRAAGGDARAAMLAGLACGLLFLARAEGALFGLALLLLPGAARLASCGVALAIGLAWLTRQLSLGPTDVIARSMLLVRYEDFFALASPDAARFFAALPAVIAAKLEALATNAVTAAFTFALILVPGIVVGARVRLVRPEVRAFAGIALVVYLAQSLLWTLHSTRGSYFHSLAALFPFGIALGVVGTRDILAKAAARRRVPLPRLLATASIAAVGAFAALSIVAVVEWDLAFDPPYRQRAAVVAEIPAAPFFFAIDAAAWRWISGRTVLVTPADGNICALPYRGPIVLEPAHFSTYDESYRSQRPIAGSDLIRVLGGCPP